MAVHLCGCGGIGRRAGFRCQWDIIPWRFESSHPHYFGVSKFLDIGGALMYYKAIVNLFVYLN